MEEAGREIASGLGLMVAYTAATSDAIDAKYVENFHHEHAEQMAWIGERKGVWSAIRPVLEPLALGRGALAPADRQPDAKFSELDWK